MGSAARRRSAPAPRLADTAGTESTYRPWPSPARHATAGTAWTAWTAGAVRTDRHPTHEKPRAIRREAAARSCPRTGLRRTGSAGGSRGRLRLLLDNRARARGSTTMSDTVSAGIGRRALLQTLAGGAASALALPALASGHPIAEHLHDQAKVTTADA